MAPPTGPSKGQPPPEKTKKAPTSTRPAPTQAQRSPPASGSSSSSPSAPREEMPPPRKPAGGHDVTRPSASLQRSTSCRDLRAQPSAAFEPTALTGQRTRDTAKEQHTQPASTATALKPKQRPVQPTKARMDPRLQKRTEAASAPTRPPVAPTSAPPPPKPSGPQLVPDSPLSPDACTGTGDDTNRARLTRDSQIADGLRQSGEASEDVLSAIADYIQRTQQSPPEPPTAQSTTSRPAEKPGPQRRTASQLSPDDDDDAETSSKFLCYGSQPLPQRQRTTSTRNYAAVTAAPAASSSSPARTTTAPSTSTSNLQTPATPTLDDDAPPTQPSSQDANPEAATATDKMKKLRYPPLIAENFPNWTTHFKALKESIGKAPNARPFGNGVRFTPADEDEYRAVQRYLENLEPPVPWFSYSLPRDKDVKLAIRGLPVDTSPEEIKGDLQDKGFDVEYVRRIRARRGRPGCIFFAICKKTDNTIPAIYSINEVLYMPGVKIDSWRGRKAPAQCHRCQQFRHSSHCCHRKLACVRCAGEHLANQCPRPLEEPATCANCQGPHPANSKNCPILKKEMKNRRAGTVALTTTAVAPLARNEVSEHAAATLMAPANLPRNLSRQESTRTTDTGKKKKKKKNKKKKKTAPASQEATATVAATTSEQRTKTAPTSTQQRPAKLAPRASLDEGKLKVIEAAILTLQEVLNALKAGTDPVPVILQGISKLIDASYG